MMHANDGQATPNFQYQSTFKPELPLEQVKDSEKHSNEMAVVRRITLVLLSKTQEELTEIAKNNANLTTEILEQLESYILHLSCMLECTNSAMARLLIVSGGRT